MNETIERLMPKTEKEAKATILLFVVAAVAFVVVAKICA